MNTLENAVNDAISALRYHYENDQDNREYRDAEGYGMSRDYVLHILPIITTLETALANHLSALSPAQLPARAPVPTLQKPSK
jgi:hypothetical protein